MSKKEQTTLLKPCPYYSLFPQYPWAKDARDKHIAMHWEISQVSHIRTKREFYDLTKEEQETIMRILQFFTQADTGVCNNYIDNLLPVFRGFEAFAMLLEFANRETVHVEAYAKLVEVLGLPRDRLDLFFKEFEAIAEMKDKNDFLQEQSLQRLILTRKLAELDNKEISKEEDTKYRKAVLKNLICFALFTEGLQLYSSFAILLEPSKAENGGLLRGLSETVEWSLKDEDEHTRGGLRLALEFIRENQDVFDEELKSDLYKICGTIIHFEDAFIDYAFKPCNGKFMNLTSKEVKQYIRYLADYRLKQIGLKPMYQIDKNPLPYMERFLKTGITNFFESIVTDYTHNKMEGEWTECEYN
jgi:ribonucleoside-diphosphate reductase beta chain